MAKPIAAPRETTPALSIVLDGRTPIRLSLGQWAQGAGRSAFVALSANADRSAPIHDTLGALCAANADGELVLELDPLAARENLRAFPGDRVWAVATVSPYERRLAGTAWAPVAVQLIRP